MMGEEKVEDAVGASVSQRAMELGDAFVKKTGLYRITMIEPPEPRNLRWLPILVLVGLVVGPAAMVLAHEYAAEYGFRAHLFVTAGGGLLFYAACGTAMFLRYFGPRLFTTEGAPLDEREAAIGARAGRLAGMLVSLLAAAGCFYFSGASLFDWWMPKDSFGWTMTGLFLLALYNALLVLIASWLQPGPVPED